MVKPRRIQRTDLAPGATLLLKKDGSVYTVGETSHGHQQAQAGSGPRVNWSASHFTTYGTRSVSSFYGSYSPTTLAAARTYFDLPPAQLGATQAEELRALVAVGCSQEYVQELAKKMIAINALINGTRPAV